MDPTSLFRIVGCSALPHWVRLFSGNQYGVACAFSDQSYNNLGSQRVVGVLYGADHWGSARFPPKQEGLIATLTVFLCWGGAFDTK